MTKALAVQQQDVEVRDPEALVALTPGGDGLAVQQSLVGWCDHRLAQLTRERDDARTNYEIAHKAKWRSSPFKAPVRRAEKQIAYYGKVKSALLAGYVMVPNFDAEVFAVRVKEGQRPPQREWLGWSRAPEIVPPGLPEGEGGYASGSPGVVEWERERSTGGKETVRQYAGEFDQDFDFPVKMVKPVILEAAQSAMARKLFDEIAVASGAAESQRRPDPILLGRIYNRARGGGYSPHHFVTFFLGWWLDPESI